MDFVNYIERKVKGVKTLPKGRCVGSGRLEVQCGGLSIVCMGLQYYLKLGYERLKMHIANLKTHHQK